MMRNFDKLERFRKMKKLKKISMAQQFKKMTQKQNNFLTTN